MQWTDSRQTDGRTTNVHIYITYKNYINNFFDICQVIFRGANAHRVSECSFSLGNFSSNAMKIPQAHTS